MKVVIIEDEPPAREKLAKFIRRYDSRIEILAELESVAATLGDHDLADFGNVFYRSFAAIMPKIELVVLRNAGHNAWIDAPKEFDRALNKALNKRPIAGSK
jgi:pimeloyl-ACP methyl ester carboxylesterase